MRTIFLVIGILLLTGCSTSIKVTAPTNPIDVKTLDGDVLPVRILIDPFSKNLAKLAPAVRSKGGILSCRFLIDRESYISRLNASAKVLFPKYFKFVEFGAVSRADLSVDTSAYDAVVTFSLDQWGPYFDCGATIKGPYCEYYSDTGIRVYYRRRGSDRETYYVMKKNKVSDPEDRNRKCDVLAGIITDGITAGLENGMIAVAKRVSEVIRESKK